MLTVVVPVYNGGDEIVDNVAVIRRAAGAGLADEDVEVVVVSDGSIDGTAERLLEARTEAGIRVIHYDRNLGKGYAVKAGALAGHGEWVAIVDADLDLDPGAIPSYLATAREEGLDFAIGSKRHPDSVVHYPRSRRVASWAYQQLNRLLFGLNVRDTQVGLKVFSRNVADDVLPLVLVKQFAFDLELMAVANALGYGRVRELPVRLEYRFTGSGVRSRAVVRALVDTLAIFYRLRILKTYQRKRHLLGTGSLEPDELPLVSIIGAPEAAQLLDYPTLELLSNVDVAEAARGANGGVLAVLGSRARPSGNWVSAAVPFIARGDAAAVVVPTLAPTRAPLREQIAAAVLESRLGGGSRRFRYLPGNVRTVSDYPAESCVIRRTDFLSALAARRTPENLVAWLAERGLRTIYLPDASISAAAPPLVGPHLRGTLRHARARGGAARRTRGRSLSRATLLSLTPAMAGGLGLCLVAAGSSWSWWIGAALLVVYGVALAGSSLAATVRFHSFWVGLPTAPALVATQIAYVAGFLVGLARGR